jgi:hypothetical protein
MRRGQGEARPGTFFKRLSCERGAWEQRPAPTWPAAAARGRQGTPAAAAAVRCVQLAGCCCLPALGLSPGARLSTTTITASPFHTRLRSARRLRTRRVCTASLVFAHATACSQARLRPSSEAAQASSLAGTASLCAMQAPLSPVAAGPSSNAGSSAAPPSERLVHLRIKSPSLPLSSSLSSSTLGAGALDSLAVAPHTTIAQVKRHIEAAWPGRPRAEGMRCIRAGRLMQDEETVEGMGGVSTREVERRSGGSSAEAWGETRDTREAGRGPLARGTRIGHERVQARSPLLLWHAAL